MPSLHPPAGWIAADPTTPGTDMESTWWTSKIDMDLAVFETGDASVVFKTATSGTVYLISEDFIPVTFGQRVKARARVLNDNWASTESRFVVGMAFYDSSGTHIASRTRDSFGISVTAFNNIWRTVTHTTSVDDTDIAYAKTVIGRASTSGDTNTIWVDQADLIFEPVYDDFVRSTSASLSSGVNTIVLNSSGGNDGLYLQADGTIIVLEGGTYIVHGAAELTMSSNTSGRLALSKGRVGSGTIIDSTFAVGDEHTFVAANLTQQCEVNGIEFFDSGDRITLQADTSGSVTVSALAELRAVRVRG